MLKKQKSIKKNFIMNAVLTMSTFIFPLITFPYISRVLLPVGTGKINFATSFISYFTMCAQLGLPTYGIRVCAKVRDNKVELTRNVHELLMINLFMTVLAYCVFFSILLTVSKLQEDRILYLIMSSTIFLNAIGVEWLYKALEQYTYITIRSIVFKFISIIAMFLLVHEKENYIIYAVITIFASSASNILNFINMHKFVIFKPVGKYNFKRHLKAIIIFFAMACATTIYTNLDTVMLGFMKTDEDVGYYSAAVKIKIILVSIVTSLGTVLLPRCSYYVEHQLFEEFQKICAKALNFVFILATPLMVYFILFAKEGIYFLSGSSYEKSILPMQIIMPTLLFIGISNILGMQILVPLGKEKIVLYSEIIGAMVNLIVNFILIPKYASIGAAIGTVLAEAIVFIVQYIYLREEIKGIFLRIHYLRICFVLSLASVISIVVKIFNLGNFLTLVISASLFFSIYGLILLVKKEEIIVEIYEQLSSRVLKRKRKRKCIE